MLKTLSLFALTLTVTCAAQNAPKIIALTGNSNVATKDILNPLRKDCPNVNITSDVANSDYTLEAIKTTVRQGLRIVSENTFEFTIFDRGSKTLRSSSTTSLSSALKDLCHAIKTFVMVKVVDTNNLTESIVANGPTGRRTHTDASTIFVIVNGEHALLDCYERRTGCSTVGPGKYYGEQDGDGIWVNYQMPVTHKWVREHYKVAGSW
jgi:hypothetical protein